MSLNRACRILSLARSTYYNTLRSPSESSVSRGRTNTSCTYNRFEKRKVPDEEVICEIEEILSQKFVLYGYKKVTAALQRRGYLINHKKVYRLMKEKDLLLKEFRKRNYKRRNIEDVKDDVTGPDQKWSIDIKYGKALNGDRCYIIAVKDCYTKEILSIQVERKRTANQIESALYQALASRNIKKIPVKELSVISDNGKEIIKAMGALKKLGVKHVRITPHSPWENGEVESFFSCLEREVFWRFEIENFEEMKELVVEYAIFYNTERLHGGIGYKTPKEKYKEYIASQQREVLAKVG